MSDEYKDNKIETKSADSSSGGYAPPAEHIPAKEAPEQELYHAKSFWTKWVFSQDAKVIGVQYALTATAIGLIGLVLSWGMRLQLGFPETFSFLGPATYYQSVTMHGMIMVIYLLTALFLGGFGNYLIPLMVGARDMGFPYVNMVSYWMFLVSVLVLIASFFVPGGPTGAGWTLYPPQAILPGTPGSEYGIVLMLISLSLFVIGFTMGGLNYVITVLQARTRGMTLMRMPLTVWGIFTATVLALLAFPALLVACIMMTLDSVLGTSFFMPDIFTMGEKLKTGGGSPILFQHLFWFFGHPEVYIMILPAFGVVSHIISTFSRKPIFGYSSMVYALTSIAILSFVVWAHHMFTVGMPLAGELFFMYSTMIIAIPTGVKVFNWVATMFKGSISFETPMLFAIAFVALFTIGGFSGLMLAIVPADFQYHDTYFVVAHFHYVLVPGSLFGIIAGVYYWIPKWTGNMYDETLGKLHFWLTFISVNLTFFPMHFVGLAGMPRRYPDYALQFADFNAMASVGAFIFGFTQLLLLFIVIKSIRTGKKASNKVWEDTRDTGLEWTLESPPPYHTFTVQPEVK